MSLFAQWRMVDLYSNGIGLRWSQRVITCEAPHRNRKEYQIARTLWARLPPALELLSVFRLAVGREGRLTKAGGIDLLSKVAMFG